MKIRIYFGFSIALVIGFAVAAGIQTPSRQSVADETAEGGRFSTSKTYNQTDSLMIAAAYSRKCATPERSCTLRKPKKVGSRCQCPDNDKDSKKVTGKVVR